MTLREIARQLLDDAEGDLARARKGIAATLEDPEMRGFLDHIAHEAIDRELGHLWIGLRNGNGAVPAHVLKKGEASKSEVLEWACNRAKRALMRFPISRATGLELGDAKRPDLEAWSLMQQASLRTQSHHYFFVAGVIARLTSDRSKVKSQLSEGDLEGIWDGAAEMALGIVGKTA